MLKFNIVTADEIIQTGRISFKFIFDSAMDYNNHEKVDNWGVILKDLKNNDIMVNVFNSNGLVFGWGNNKLNDEKWITSLLDRLPTCSLLMEKDDSEIFKEYCEKLGYEYTYTYFEGSLKTA